MFVTYVGWAKSHPTTCCFIRLDIRSATLHSHPITPAEHAMPVFKKNVIAAFLSGILIILIPTYGHEENRTHESTVIYYVRLDQKIINGTYQTEALTMVPAHGDYRCRAFKTQRITGRVTAESKPDPLSDAKHDAISRLLLQNGVKSVRSTASKDTQNTYEENVVSYEGYIKTPYTIIAQDYSSDNTVFSADIEVDFAPMAYPPEWSFRYLGQKIRDGFDAVLSLFQ